MRRRDRQRGGGEHAEQKGLRELLEHQSFS